MHYKAMGDLGYTGSLNDRIHKYLTEEYGSFYEALRDLRNGTSVFSLISSYAVNSFDPALVFDFKKNYYRTGGTNSTLSSSVTHTRAGQATMVGSDGLLKYAPHNLLTYSSDFTNSSYSKVNVTIGSDNIVAPDGTTTADTVTATGSSYIQATLNSANTSIGYTLSVWMKVPSGTTSVDMGNIDAGVYITKTVTTDWQLFSVTQTPSATTRYPRVFRKTSGDVTVHIWGAHLYRSDLGGMVNNPAQPTGLETYVPTTSSAVYLPRVGHHSYNGSAWVNEGVLYESEARTNRATNSNLFSSNNYTKNNISVTASSVTSPDGSNNGWKITPTGTNPYIRRGGGISGNFTHSLYVKKDTADYVVLGHGAGSKGLLINFSFASGTVVDTHAYGSSTTYISNTVENVDNGWYRISVTGNTGASNNLAILPWDSATAPTNLDSSSNASSSTVYIYGAQTEVASTPSSYIPTTGSTVTRAAETLTVPAANMPWATPVVIGSELITNGTFDSNTNDWTAGSSTLSVDSNRLKVTNTGSFGKALQDFTTVTGKVYLVTGDYIAGDVDGYVQLEDRNGGGTIYSDFSHAYQTDKTVSVFFTAVSNETRIALFNRYGSAGNINFWDNISIKEINPFSVSIQMDGRMTGENLTPIRWLEDADNAILLETGTNNFTFTQEAYGTVDTVTGGSFTSGTFVTFNTSSRHGFTFLNGAVDGTALTANTTPTALPNLVITDLDLGYDFMGTIGKFRVWSDDLTDTGIEEAST